MAASQSRMVAALAHFDNVSRAKKVGDRQVGINFEGIFNASDVDEVSQRFGWEISGASAEQNLLWFQKE